MSNQKRGQITDTTKGGLLLIAQQTIQRGDTKNVLYVMTTTKPPYLRYLKSPTSDELGKESFAY